MLKIPVLCNRVFVVSAAAVAVVSVLGHLQRDTAAQVSRDVTQAQVSSWMTELSNWGRWGDDDQLGALNLITPEKRKQAAALATGVSVFVVSGRDKLVDASEFFELLGEVERATLQVCAQQIVPGSSSEEDLTSEQLDEINARSCEFRALLRIPAP